MNSAAVTKRGAVRDSEPFQLHGETRGGGMGHVAEPPRRSWAGLDHAGDTSHHGCAEWERAGISLPTSNISPLLFPSLHLGGIAKLHPLLPGISIAPGGSPTMCPGVTHQQQTVKRKKIGWKYQCTLVTINPAFNLC